MIYFRPIEDIEKAKGFLERKTGKFKPILSYYEEGFYSKVYKNYVHIMYEDGRQLESSKKDNIRPHFHGFCFTFKDKQYLFGVFCLDLALLLFVLGGILFGVFVFDFEEAWFGIGVYIIFLVLNIKNIKGLRNFLDTL
ncbi:MAG: hypothetical protein IJ447_06955 [Clostridia bacterium]|nr:hypothetical protein [Clostridia bacterium]